MTHINDPDEPASEQPRTIYTVSSLTAEIKESLEAQFGSIWLEGEISNFRAPGSGHFYLVLKDEESQIRAVMFRPQSRYLKFRPEDGMKVIVQGRLGLYEPRGEYQIILDYMEPLGVGALALALEQLKKKLAAQGVFDPALKKPLPYLPQRVAVITSPTGAAIRDFLKVIQRRFANIEIIIVPVKVQGDEAAGEMIEALRVVNQLRAVDVIVLTRGGGSLEDLWAFNDEKLALAIRASRVPVVSAVGHEIDITIADLAADLRAPTPSAAAELLVAEKEGLQKRLQDTASRLLLLFKNQLSRARQQLIFLTRGLRDPRKGLADAWLKLDDLQDRLGRLMETNMKERKNRLSFANRTLLLYSPLHMVAALRQNLAYYGQGQIKAIQRSLKDGRAHFFLLEEKLKNLNPMSVLKRGYSLTRKWPEKEILKSAREVQPGRQVQILLAEGELECRVEKVILNKG